MLTPAQHGARRNWLGASDIAAIVGESPYTDAFSLWAEKTGKVPASEVGDAAEWGNILEPVILDCAGKALGRRVVKSTGTFTHPDLACVRVNPDGFVDASKRGNPIVEGKSTSISEGWGEDGSDQVPTHVLIQVTMQMRCTDSAFAHVARLYHKMGHPDFKLYTVAFSRSLSDALDEAAGEFWRVNVQGDNPPDVTALSLPALGKIGRAAKAVQVDPALVVAYADARAAEKAAQAAKKNAAARLIAALGDGDAADVPGWKAKYISVSQSRVDLDAMRAADPELVARCTKSEPYRKLDVRAIKEKS